MAMTETHSPSPGPNRSASTAEVAPQASDAANEDTCEKTSVVLVAEIKEFSTKASLFTIENLIKKSPPAPNRTREEAPPPADGTHHQVSTWSAENFAVQQSAKQAKHYWWPVVCSSS
jgi:hypothetical protein